MDPEMTGKQEHKRKNHFIKKRFQLNFSIRFLTLIIVEALLLAGLFWYLSSDTLTTSYHGAQLRIENTPSFFFPSMAYAGLIVIGVICIIGLIGLVYISHKIAGPLYRFEESLKVIGEGDLTHRINLRKRDQLSDLAETINTFSSTVENKVLDMKANLHDITKTMAEIQLSLSSDNTVEVTRIEPLFKELSKRLNQIKDAVDHFETSGERKKE